MYVVSQHIFNPIRSKTCTTTKKKDERRDQPI